MALFTDLLNFSMKSDSELFPALRFFLKPRLGFKKATGTAAAKVPTRYKSVRSQIAMITFKTFLHWFVITGINLHMT